MVFNQVIVVLIRISQHWMTYVSISILIVVVKHLYHMRDLLNKYNRLLNESKELSGETTGGISAGQSIKLNEGQGGKDTWPQRETHARTSDWVLSCKL